MHRVRNAGWRYRTGRSMARLRGLREPAHMPIDDLLIFQRIVVHANCRVVDIRQRVLAEQ
jgi:hypothetical protein